jgi:RNA polymerase sigma-70 factor (ECF subfamily)
MDEVLSDDEAVSAVLSGDTASYREIVERHQNMVFGIGKRFFRNDDDASDFSQDVFIRAFEKLGMYREKGRFRFWLAKIAYNSAVNRIKSVRRDEPLVSPDLAVSKEKSVSRTCEEAEMSEILTRAVSELPEEYRICVDLYFFSGMSYPQISEITGTPVGTIKSNVYRAKSILRDALRGTIAEDYHEM